MDLTSFANTAEEIKPETITISPDDELEAVDELNERYDAEAAAKRAQAFVDAGAFTLYGKSLQPFSSGRRSLFEEIRFAVGAGSLRSVLEAVSETGEPAAFLPEASRILFLCAHTFDELMEIRLKCGSLVKVQIKIDEWMNEAMPNELAQRAACAMALQVFNQSSSNQAEVAPRKGGMSQTKGGDSISLGESGSPTGRRSILPSSPVGTVGQKTSSGGNSHSQEAGRITTRLDY